MPSRRRIVKVCLYLVLAVAAVQIIISIGFHGYIRTRQVPFDPRLLLGLDDAHTEHMQQEYNTGHNTQTAVLMLTLGRSGSTLLGELLDTHEHVLYWDEPFYGRHGENADSFDYQLEIITSILQCRFEGYRIEGYLDEYFENAPRRVKRSKVLLRVAKGTRQGNDSCSTMPKTIDRLNCVCTELQRNGPLHVVVKVLHQRLSKDGQGTIYARLFHSTSNRNLKVIHLVRDPRAVAASMMVAGWNNSLFVRNTMSSHVCDKTVGVWHAIQNISQKSDRKTAIYRSVTYETLIRRPHATVDGLLRYIGLSMQSSVYQYLNNKIASNRSDRGIRHYSTTRRWHDHLQAWNTTLSDYQQKALARNCTEYARIFGYSLLNSP